MRAAVAAVLAFAVFLGLGFAVSGRPPSAFDSSELGVFGTGVAFATFCRAAGQFPPYAILCALALVFGLVRRAYLSAAIVLIVMMLAIWKISDAFKGVFHRVRPEHWLVAHETSASYPSGHATLVLAFFGFVAIVVLRSALPAAVRAAVAAACVAWIVALGWSRLALGAHYPTDVLGGYVLGGAAVCCAVLAYDRTRGRIPERMPPPTRSRYTR